MPDLIRKILALLSPAERRRAYLLLGMILIMAFLDMVGVASIMPFMAVLANPTVVETNPYLNAVYTRLNFTDPPAFLFFLGALPRYALEAIAFGGMLLVVLYLLGSDGGVQKALPIIAVYALAGYRMMPAIQLLYAAITRLRFAGAALDNLHSDILRPVVQAGFRWRDARPLSRSRAR